MQTPRMLSARVRTLGSILLVACAGLLIAGGITFGLQYARMLATVDQKLQTKVEALSKPNAGESTVDYVSRITSGFLPLPNEAVAGLVDGEPRSYPKAGTEFRPIYDDALVADAVAAVDRTGSTALGTVQTSEGAVRYIAVPLDVPGDSSEGVYLRVIGLDEEVAPVTASIMTYAITGVIVLVSVGVVGWFVTGRLLSPLRQLREAADAVTYDDLGARVPETGADEIADLSRTMNSMLERLELSVESQRQLLDDIRHELKTPITIVRGHLEMMDVSDPLDVVGTRDIGIAELDRMTRLVEDLDLLSSAQDDQFSMQPLDVGMLTDRVGELVSAIPGHPFSVGARARGIVLGDADRLTQAWLQLADNAAKYTPAHSPIEIGSELVDGEVRLWVRDHGAGIPPASRRRIFRRFDRADTHRTVGGSGLGLAIVDAIAKAHAGSCLVTDTPGGGATFTISVPASGHPESAVPTPVRAGDVVLQREAST